MTFTTHLPHPSFCARVAQSSGMTVPSLGKAGHLVAWQVGSILLTVTGYTSQRLARLGIDCPTAQTSLVYLVLSLHAVPLLLRHRRRGPCEDEEERKGKMRWWHWALVAAADLEANFLVVLAYQYTDIISVMILDAFTIPTVIVLSTSCFGTRYSRQQLGAAVLCILGIGALVATDVAASQELEASGIEKEESGRPARAWVGDILVLLGAALYGCSNVAQEHLVRRLDRTRYLAWLGGIGFLIAACQTAAVERNALATAWAALTNGSASDGGRGRLTDKGGNGSGTSGVLLEAALLESGFVAAMSGVYMLCALLLESGSSATLMNLSLLTSDFMAVLVGVGLLHSRPGPGYAAAFCLTISGLLIYHCSAGGGAAGDAQSRTGLAQPFIGRGEAHEQVDRAPDRAASAGRCAPPVERQGAPSAGANLQLHLQREEGGSARG